MKNRKSGRIAEAIETATAKQAEPDQDHDETGGWQEWAVRGYSPLTTLSQHLPVEAFDR